MNNTLPSVVVTGGATGIGYAIALAFSLKGHKVAIVDLSASSATEAAKKLTEATGIIAHGVAADVSDANACATAYAEIVSTLGPVGVLINNAGVMPPRKGWIEELPPDDFKNMMDIHLGGAVNWCRLVMPDMRAANFGRIINMSSVNGVQPVPHRFAYVTAKKAIRGLTEALALDCARAGITVNAIAPGYTLTDTLLDRANQGLLDHDAIASRTPVGRWGKPEEIAHAVLFLADSASGYLTGTTMVVDGGLSLRGDADDDLDQSPFIDTSATP